MNEQKRQNICCNLSKAAIAVFYVVLTFCLFYYLVENGKLASSIFKTSAEQRSAAKTTANLSSKFPPPSKFAKNRTTINIGFVVMATGRYGSWTKRLVESARKFVLADELYRGFYKLTFFIFADHLDEIANGSDVVPIFQRRLGWPSDTLWRCPIYLRNADAFKQANIDYLFSTDADMAFVGPVGPEILGDLVGVLHPGFVNKDRSQFTYEQRSESCARILPNEGANYFAGGVFGGRTANVLKLCEAINKCILDDLSRNFTAIWHDESQLNRYFINRPPYVILSPAYCYPEGYSMPYEPKLLALNKNHAKMRE